MDFDFNNTATDKLFPDDVPDDIIVDAKKRRAWILHEKPLLGAGFAGFGISYNSHRPFSSRFGAKAAPSRYLTKSGCPSPSGTT